MPNKTVYIKDEKQWNAAIRILHVQGRSMSAFLHDAITEYVTRSEHEELDRAITAAKTKAAKVIPIRKGSKP